MSNTIHFRESVRIAKRTDRFTKDQKPFVSLLFFKDSTTFDKDTNKPIGLPINCTVFADKDTNDLPKVLNYIQKGSVVEIEGVLDLHSYFDSQTGAKTSSLEVKFPRFHLLPRQSVEETVADEAPAPTVAPEVDEPDPFLDE